MHKNDTARVLGWVYYSQPLLKTTLLLDALKLVLWYLLWNRDQHLCNQQLNLSVSFPASHWFSQNSLAFWTLKLQQKKKKKRKKVSAGLWINLSTSWDCKLQHTYYSLLELAETTRRYISILWLLAAAVWDI